MQLRNTQDSYGLIPKALHWAVVPVIDSISPNGRDTASRIDLDQPGLLCGGQRTAMHPLTPVNEAGRDLS